MFKLDTQGAVHVVHGDAPLNIDSVEEMDKLLGECLGKGLPRIVIDLKRIPLIDSAGLNLLLDFKDRCQRSGGDVKLAAPNRLCEDILFMTGLDQSIEVFEEMLRAVGSFVR